MKNRLETPTNKLITTKILTKFLTEKATLINGCQSYKNSKKKSKPIKSTTKNCIKPIKILNKSLKISQKPFKRTLCSKIMFFSVSSILMPNQRPVLKKLKKSRRLTQSIWGLKCWPCSSTQSCPHKGPKNKLKKNSTICSNWVKSCITPQAFTSFKQPWLPKWGRAASWLFTEGRRMRTLRTWQRPWISTNHFLKWWSGTSVESAWLRLRKLRSKWTFLSFSCH